MNNMKMIKKIAILLSLICFTTGCDHVYNILLINKSNKSIYVFSPELIYDIDIYPDTVLPIGIVRYDDNIMYGSDSTHIIYESLSGWYHSFSKKDTVSIYIFDNDTIDLYSWDSVINKNLILQRYDLGFEDVNGLCISNNYVSLLHFPPTEQMKHIHMWPPYGTYDENGQKKSNKK